MASIERKIDLGGRSLSYTFKASVRARHIRLSVHRGGILAVTAPLMASREIVERFIVRKSEWVIEHVDKQSKFAPLVKTTRADFLKHKESARRLVEEKIRKLNAHYGYKIGRIAIRDQRSRWGSCSSKGNLNFNYKIALIPDHLAEYIVAHELCHRGELNHSKRFWALVEKTIPDYRERRKELEKSGLRPS